MSKSSAHKKRLHSIRNGASNPEMLRGADSGLSLHVRKTKTKADKVKKEVFKHKKRFLSEKRDEGNRFYYTFSDAKSIASVNRQALACDKRRVV